MKDIEEIKKVIEQEENFIDDSDDDYEEEYTRYDITSYGVDFDVEGLVRRLKRDEIFIPPFQRDYVWKMPEASRFIESLLLGLPVPGIFLAQEPNTGKMLVIDGQQRLLSLLYYYLGEFKPQENQKTKRIFRLSKVKKQFDGVTYDELESRDRINLDNSVIHATVVKQETPAEDDTSIYHIFERLNSGGRKLTPQEIRVAVYHGELIELAKKLNELPEWRHIFGPKNDRMKDVELIIRFWAMKERFNYYNKPMIDFINKFCYKNRECKEKCGYYEQIFTLTIQAFHSAIDEKLFRPIRALNVALYEACMVGLATRFDKGYPVDDEIVQIGYENLLSNPEFQDLTSQSTSDVKNVKRRMELAIEEFSRV
ncbi:DUF262 domain-containing protein [Cronobacter dublinensis]|nr:DUF262 domain-containing protein [Cronobacter dublinensis]EMA8652920.1 DUF262 domain-containing protein [Cronobacter dublinensis]